MIATLDKRKKSEMRVSTNWYVTIEYWRSSLIRVSLSIIRLANYSVTTSFI